MARRCPGHPRFQCRATINARPCLTINKLPQHVRQVTNDQRQNRPSGKVIPADDRADIELAEIFDGMVRHIEYISDADVAYDTACENQVSFGEGYFRLLTEYCDDDTFDQDIRIGRIRNSFSVYMDPHDPRSLWVGCTVVLHHRRHADRRLRAHIPKCSADIVTPDTSVGDQMLSQWINENTVRVAEYFLLNTNRRH